MTTQKNFGGCPKCCARIDGHDFAARVGDPEPGDTSRAPQADDVLICCECAALLIVEQDNVTVRELDIHELSPLEAGIILVTRDAVIRSIRARSARNN